jgi:hypothetical protein
MLGSNALTRPWAELLFYDSKLRECFKLIGENEPKSLRTMAEAHSELLERKNLKQCTAKMMDEQIGQAARQYTQQGPSSLKPILKNPEQMKSLVHPVHAHLEAILYNCRVYSLCGQPGGPPSRGIFTDSAKKATFRGFSKRLLWYYQ